MMKPTKIDTEVFKNVIKEFSGAYLDIDLNGMSSTAQARFLKAKDQLFINIHTLYFLAKRHNELIDNGFYASQPVNANEKDEIDW